MNRPGCGRVMPERVHRKIGVLLIHGNGLGLSLAGLEDDAGETSFGRRPFEGTKHDGRESLPPSGLSHVHPFDFGGSLAPVSTPSAVAIPSAVTIPNAL